MFFKKKEQPEQEFVWRDFREKTYDELEKEVDAAYGKEVKARNIKLAILTVILLFVFHDIAGFWVRFGIPRMPAKAEQIVDTSLDPIEEELDEEEEEDPIFNYITLEDKSEVKIRKRSAISISGRIVARNFLFWGNYLPGGKRIFQSAAMYDLGLVWGELANREVLKHYTFYCSKDTQARNLYPTLKMGVKYPPKPWPYVRTHMRHLCIVPANATIMSGLIYSFKNQPIKLDGYVVNVQVEDGRWKSGFATKNPDSRQGEAQVLYVNKIQVGKRVYE